MGLFGCLKPAATEDTTVCENQTFRSSDQASTSLTTAGDGQTYSDDASVNAYTPPTEHQLPWSHAAHPPSVASSILLDPEGQAFAKHYNPLLSQNTSQESLDSSNQHQAVPAHRFDEHAQDSHPSSPQVSTAATRQARPVADTAATWKLGSKGANTDGTLHVQQVTDRDAKMQQEQADDIIRKQNNLAAASTAQMPTSSLTKKSGIQPKLGNQIALALQRHGKGMQSSLKAAVAAPAPPDQARALLPHHAALSQKVAQIEGDEHSNKVAIPNDSPVSPFVPAPNLASTGSRTLCQPQPSKAEGLQHSDPSAAAVLPSMTAETASYPAGTKHAETPAPPSPSIDRCSSTSSWGASTAPSSALQSHLTVSALTAVNANPIDPVSISDQPLSGLRDSSIKQQVHSPTVRIKHGSKQALLARQLTPDSIQAMHVNSSSWRKQGDLTEGVLHSSANSSCRASVSTKQAALKAAARQKQAKMIECNMAVANTAGQQKQAAGVSISTAAETLEGPEVSPPSQAWPPARTAGEAKDAKKQQKGLEKTIPAASQENVTPNADPSPMPAVAPLLSKTGSQPQQTLEEMTAWLDAQLAKAPGSQHGQGTAIIADTARPKPASRSKPTGLPAPRGHSRPGAGQIKLTQGQHQNRNSQSSLHAGENKGQSMSVSEMMQWLDSTLAQAAVSQQPARQAPCLRMDTSHCTDTPDDPAHPSCPASAQATASEEAAANQTMKGNAEPSSVSSHAPACPAPTPGDISSQAGAAICGQVQVGAAPATASIDLCRPSVPSTAESSHLAYPAQESESHKQQSCPSARLPEHPAHGSETCAASAIPDVQLSQPSNGDTIQQHPLAVSAAVQGVPQTKTAGVVPSSISQPASVVTSAASVHKQHSIAPASPAAAQQSAAEMLQWLDATLAAKKPAATKQPLPAAACQPQVTSSVTAPVKSAGPGDMLAWLDAKIATAKKTATSV